MKPRVLALAGLMGLSLWAFGLTSCRSQPLPLPPGEGGMVIFRQATFETILPDTRPGAGEITRNLSLTAAQGEIEAVSFAVIPQKTIAPATVQVSDLQGPEGATIPASAVDVRVVQVWEQKALRGKSFDKTLVPEALLKDDSLNWLDAQWTEDNLPSCPPGAAVCTTLTPDQTKQFFVTVKVPAEARAGAYTGEIRVGDMVDPAKVTLALQVLPFTLRGPGKIIGMYYNDNITAQTPLEVYRARLAALREMNVTALRIKGLPESAEQELKEVKAAGFPGPIMILDEGAFYGPQGLKDLQLYIAALRGLGYDPYLYGVDEPNTPNLGPRERHSLNGQIALYPRLKRAGGLVATALTVQTDEMLVKEHQQLLDFPLYSTNTGQGFKEYVAQLDADPAAKRHPQEGYYFGCWAENPRRNRLLAGLYLYHSHMEAVFGWTLWSFHAKNTPQVFNDFDLEGNKKRWLTVFPTREGCVPTVQSEAWREGVDDLRYLNTFLELAKEKEQELAPAVVDALRRQVLAEVAKYQDMGENKPEDATAAQYTNQQFDDTRQVIAQAILKLLAPQ